MRMNLCFIWTEDVASLNEFTASQGIVHGIQNVMVNLHVILVHLLE